MASGHGGGCGLAELIVFIMALVFGTACSLTSKVLLQMKSVGLTGELENFTNPLFQTFGMFVGMLASLPMHWAVKKFKIPFPGYSHYDETKGKYVTIAGDEQVEKPKEPDWSVYFALLIPSLFDLAATALCMFGLMHVDVSIYQMLRGGSIVFVALLKQFMLGDKLKTFMWVGVFWNVVSIVLVGLTAYLAAAGGSGDTSAADAARRLLSGRHHDHHVGSDDLSTHVPDSGVDPASVVVSQSSEALYGVLLILLGAVVQSLQYAFEEKVMSMDVGAPPLLLIGMEGFWGAAVCFFILYPIAYYSHGDDHGCIENPYNTMAMLKNSEDLQWMFLLYFISIFGYNMLCALITFMLNSVWHAILDNFRPITVWSSSVFIFYLVNTEYGEAWTQYSYIQLCGMFVLLYGTAIYNAPNAGSIKLTGGPSSCLMDFTEEYMDAEEEASNALQSGAVAMSPHYSSMSPFQSPGTRDAKLRSQERQEALAKANAANRNYGGTDVEMANKRSKMPRQGSIG